MPDDTALHILRQRPTETARFIAEDCLARESEPARSLYIHVPFCEHKCHYCDFYSFVDSRDRQNQFTRRLIREIRAAAPLAQGRPLNTIFVGGGTPTLLTEACWASLLDALHETFAFAPETEFTVECNPETACSELFGLLSRGGVNRMSIGAQSFDPKHLRTLERLHNPSNVGRTIDLAHAAGIERCSIDLIYAIPGQTMDELHADLDAALALPIDHLSAYNLTYEPNTAMTKRLERGEFVPAPDDLEAEMFERIADRLGSAGFERYEVSNYAQPGRACRHNLAYWRQEPWLAAGPSASGHIGGHRYKIVPRLDDYLKCDDDGFALVVDHEPPDQCRAIAERVMTGLRLREGIDATGLLSEVRAMDPGIAEGLMGEAGRCESLGWLVERDGRWSLTDAGLLYADGIASEMISILLR